MKNLYSIVFVSGATLLSGLLSYLYHPIAIRYLSIEDFGVFESLLSLLNIFLVIIIALGLFYTKEVSRKTNNLRYAKGYRKASFKVVTKIGLLSSILFIAIVPGLSVLLNIPFYYFLPLSLTIFFSFYAVTNNAFFQGFGKFKFIASIISIGSILKLLIGIFLLYIGLDIFGAILGVIIAQILMFFIGEIYLRKFFKNITSTKVKETQVTFSFIEKKKQILQYLFTSILIALLMNIDILIVKNMFGGETAGYYAALSVLAKFLVFLGLSIETVYYPQLVKGKVFPIKQILKISGYYILMLLGALGFFWIFGEMILRLFKDGLQSYISVVFPLLIYCGILGYISIIVKTLIAFEKYLVNSILLVTIVCMISATYMYATDIYSLAYIFMFGSIGGLIACLGSLLLIKNSGE